MNERNEILALVNYHVRDKDTVLHGRLFRFGMSWSTWSRLANDLVLMTIEDLQSVIPEVLAEG